MFFYISFKGYVLPPQFDAEDSVNWYNKYNLNQCCKQKSVNVTNSKACIITFFFIIKEPDVLFCPQAMEPIQVPEN